jgi:parallel beta-helix repeat protein
MRQKHAKIAIFLITFTLYGGLVAGAQTNLLQWSEISGDKVLEANLNTPLVIDGNYWLGQNATSGYGNSTHPYIIENLYIDGGQNDCITIKFTDMYFILRNCTVVNGRYGIYLLHVQHGFITHNQAWNNTDGIELSNCKNNTVFNNTAKQNQYGISLASSDNNMLSYNTLWNNTLAGIFMGDSTSNNVTGNVASDRKGIYLWYANFNNITNNVVNASAWGLHFQGSHNNSIAGNYFQQNSYGIHLSNSDNNTVSNNTVTNNIYGVTLGKSRLNEVKNNTINHNSDGISLNEANNNTIFNNTISYNSYYAMTLSESNDNRILWNTLSCNAKTIYEYNCSGNTFAHNTIETCGPAIPGFPWIVLNLGLFVVVYVVQTTKKLEK